MLKKKNAEIYRTGIIERIFSLSVHVKSQDVKHKTVSLEELVKYCNCEA